jgi:hypothetical protein
LRPFGLLDVARIGSNHSLFQVLRRRIEPALDATAQSWQFSFTPYAWVIGATGSVTARGHKVDFDVSIWDMFDSGDSKVGLDSLLAFMSYFEARKGRFGVFTDVVWGNLDFSGSAQSDFGKSRNRNFGQDFGLAAAAPRDRVSCVRVVPAASRSVGVEPAAWLGADEGKNYLNSARSSEGDQACRTADFIDSIDP